jgi:Calcineurin-like phosphoesterase
MISKQVKYRIAAGGTLCLCMWAALSAAQQAQQSVDALTTVTEITQVLSRPTDHSVSVNVLAPTDMEAYVEYGTKPGKYSVKTAVAKSAAKAPFDIVVDRLKPNTEYFYRLQYREGDKGAYKPAAEYSFHTARPANSPFVFDVQADSHPERVKNMFDATMYGRTMESVKKDKADFYVTLGDDFSIDGLGKEPTPEIVSQVYINQRKYLGMGGASVPVFLVNGGHESAAGYLLDGTPNNPAVWAGNARNRYFSQPGPDGFYTGDAEPIEYVGLPRDYYAWTWGDALFITLDPYWHSKVMFGTGNGLGKNKESKKAKDYWDITHGEAQYRWLKQTLERSNAKYKFIFAHHVLGTDRGGIEMADLYEWGGRTHDGVWEFDKKRPGWDMPIHQLMVKYGVSIFFQGHDHVFVRQEKDGVIYQETPNPASPFLVDPNNGGWQDAYKSGDFLPPSGHLKVTVTPETTKVEYIRAWLPKDETADHKNDEVAFTYSVKPRRGN